MADNTHPGNRLGILVGGGPAPGINSVIEAVTLEAMAHGLEVIGIFDGFKWLCLGDTSHVNPLTLDVVAGIHTRGGSILRTSRENPGQDPTTLMQVEQVLLGLRLDYLVTIGGDDTALAATRVDRRMGDRLRVVHVPKTIDNDLPLPDHAPTFGFQTARHLGADLVRNLMEDARTTGRWYLVVIQGRKAGHLALGIGTAAGAPLILIPEELPQSGASLDQVCGVVAQAIARRREAGYDYGVAVIAEGIAERLEPKELEPFPWVKFTRDPHGQLQLREIPLARILREQIQKQLAGSGEQPTILDIDIGYELRCAPPIPFDCEYTRHLGWGAVHFLRSEEYRAGALVYLDFAEQRIKTLQLDDLLDASGERIGVRLVDVESEAFRMVRAYMLMVR